MNLIISMCDFVYHLLYFQKKVAYQKLNAIESINKVFQQWRRCSGKVQYSRHSFCRSWEVPLFVQHWCLSTGLKHDRGEHQIRMKVRERYILVFFRGKKNSTLHMVGERITFLVREEKERMINSFIWLLVIYLRIE